MYQVLIEKKCLKKFSKLDQKTRNFLYAWINKNLVNTNNPRQQGKVLKGNIGDLWRYRVGDYRLIAQINDKEITILIVTVGHRKDVYRYGQ